MAVAVPRIVEEELPTGLTLVYEPKYTTTSTLEWVKRYLVDCPVLQRGTTLHRMWAMWPFTLKDLVHNTDVRDTLQWNFNSFFVKGRRARIAVPGTCLPGLLYNVLPLPVSNFAAPSAADTGAGADVLQRIRDMVSAREPWPQSLVDAFVRDPLSSLWRHGVFGEDSAQRFGIDAETWYDYVFELVSRLPHWMYLSDNGVNHAYINSLTLFAFPSRAFSPIERVAHTDKMLRALGHLPYCIDVSIDWAHAGAYNSVKVTDTRAEFGEWIKRIAGARRGEQNFFVDICTEYDLYLELRSLFFSDSDHSHQEDRKDETFQTKSASV